MKFKVKCNGRKRGDIGVFYPLEVEIEAKTIEHAIEQFSQDYEINSKLEIIPCWCIGMPVRVRWESGEFDNDIYEVVGQHGKKVAVKNLLSTDSLTSFVHPNQLVPA